MPSGVLLIYQMGRSKILKKDVNGFIYEDRNFNKSDIPEIELIAIGLRQHALNCQQFGNSNRRNNV